MRAPILIPKFPSYPLSKTGSGLVVKSENLEFQCPEVFDLNKTDYNKKVPVVYCDVIATYEIESTRESSYSFEFISPSPESANITNSKGNTQTVASQKIPLKDADLEIYRLPKGNQKDTNELYKFGFRETLQSGSNKITVEYKQPVGFREYDYGYLKKGKWQNGFSYELWPLKEWTLHKDFRLQVQLSVKTAKGIFQSSPTLECYGSILYFRKHPFPIFKNKLTKKETGNGSWYGNWEDEPKNPFGSLEKLKKIQKTDDKVLYNIEFQSSFPDRLECSYEIN
jgi:hypothetical protein